MKRIASRDNAVFKDLRALVESALSRREAGVAMLEGVHLCDAFLRTGGRPRQVVVGERGRSHPEVVELVARAAASENFLFENRLFDALSDVERGVPILMTIDRPDPGPSSPLSSTTVLLDRVQDPGNVGSIFRSAAAAGIGAVHLSRECAGAWSPKVLRAAMGAHFRLRLFEDCDLATTISDARIPVLATAPRATTTLHAVDLSGDVAWLFGHEGQGVADALMRHARQVSIPQVDAVESLNVAAAAAICFFEQRRQSDRP